MLHEFLYSTKEVDNNIMPVRQRCENVKFKPILGRVKTYSCSFFPKTVEVWNQLPTDVTNIVDSQIFKKGIEKL